MPRSLSFLQQQQKQCCSLQSQEKYQNTEWILKSPDMFLVILKSFLSIGEETQKLFNPPPFVFFLMGLNRILIPLVTTANSFYHADKDTTPANAQFFICLSNGVSALFSILSFIFALGDLDSKEDNSFFIASSVFFLLAFTSNTISGVIRKNTMQNLQNHISSTMGMMTRTQTRNSNNELNNRSSAANYGFLRL